MLGGMAKPAKLTYRNIESGPKPAPPCGAAVGCAVSTTNGACAVVEGLGDPVADSNDSNQEAADSNALVYCADALTSSIDPPGRPMSPVTAAVVAVFCPSRAAAGTHGVSWQRLLWAQLFGVALGAVAIALVVAASEVKHLTMSLVFLKLMSIVENVLGEFVRYPGQNLLALLAIVAGIQLVFALVAFAFMSSGARDEPLRATYVHSLRQVWLSTSRITEVILFEGAV